MNRRRAGEDFCFLQSLAKTSGVEQVKGAFIHPSSRSSTRPIKSIPDGAVFLSSILLLVLIGMGGVLFLQKPATLFLVCSVLCRVDSCFANCAYHHPEKRSVSLFPDAWFRAFHSDYYEHFNAKVCKVADICPVFSIVSMGALPVLTLRLSHV